MSSLGIQTSIRHKSISKPFIGILPIIAAIGISGLFYALVVYAGTATIEQRIYVSADGEDQPFDSTTWDGVNNSSTQGTDANDHNGMVRAQDKITYTIEQSINEADATNVTSTVTLSNGQVWNSIPSVCKTDVTPASSISDDGKTLVCNTGDHDRGSKLIINAKSVVNSAQNGDTVTATATTKADNVTETAPQTTQETTVTATYGVDVENELSRSGSPSASDDQFVHGNNGPSGEAGVFIPNVITVKLNKYSELPTNTNGIGQQNLTFTIPEYGPDPQGTITPNWRIATWGDKGACSAVSGNIGTINCTQANPGDPVSISLSDIDYTKSKTPSSVLYKFTVFVWVPQSDVDAAPGDNLAYRSRIDFNPSVPASQSGLASNNNGSETNTTNNEADAGILTIPSGGYCSWISFGGDNNVGCGGSKNGTITTTVGEKNYPDRAKNSQLALKRSLKLGAHFAPNNPYSGEQVVHCLKVDHRYFEYIRPAQYREVYASNEFYEDAVYFHGDDFTSGSRKTFFNPEAATAFKWQAGSSSLLPKPIVEYSTTNIGSTDSQLQSAKCDNATATDWTTTKPADLSDITMIRTRYVVPTNYGSFSDIYENSRMTYKIRDDINPAAGTKAPVYAHLAVATNDSANIVYSPDADQPYTYTGAGSDTDTQYSADPTAANYAFNNYNIDHLNFVDGRMDVFKNIVSPDKELAPGKELTYEIKPIITGNPTVVNTTTFTIEDVLPTHSVISGVATYVPGSAVVESTNGTYASNEPTVGACSDPAYATRTCLRWELTGVNPGQDVSKITYRLKVSDQFVSTLGGNPFTNLVTITSNSASINNASDADPNTAGNQPPKDSVTLTKKTTGAYHIYKTDDLQTYDANTPDNSDNHPEFTLNYENLSQTELGPGAIIDVLPYNGDTTHNNARHNTFNANSSKASDFTDTSDKKSPGLAGAPTIPAGANIEYVVYDANNPATHPQNISSEPCHKDNLPAGFDPLTDTDHYCYLLRWDGGSGNGQLDGGGTTGTGQTPWTATAPADFNDVVAIRVNTQALPAGSAPQKITYKIKPTGNRPADVYCNNFSSRIPNISLEVRSNTVCARVNGERPDPEELADTGQSLTTIGLITGSLLIGAVWVGGRNTLRSTR